MHWLEQEVAALQVRLRAHMATQTTRGEVLPSARATMHALARGEGAKIGRALDEIDHAVREAGKARGELRESLDELGAAICRRPGITACAMAHEGLVLSYTGPDAGADALAVVAQVCRESAASTAARLSLGAPRQMVVVGETRKLALIFFDELAVAILSPVETALSQVLSR